MALTVTFNGTNVTLADSITNWDNDTITAPEAWTTEVVHQGAACIGFQASSKDGHGVYEMPTGSFDFTPSTGTHAGQHVFIWINVTMPGTVEALSTGGLYVVIGSSLTAYKKFLIAAKDYKEVMEKGFARFVIDPSKTPTETVGSPNMAAVTVFGAWIDTDEAARIDQLFIDRIDVGWGLQITGTSSDFWNDVYAEEITETAGERDNMWGVVQKYQDIFFIYGQILIKNAAAADTVVSDSGKTIKFVSQQYYDGTSSWVDCVADDFFKIEFEDSASYKVEFTDGVSVGSDSGRAGSSFGGSNLHDTAFDADTSFGNNAASFVKLYATQLNDFRAGILFHDDADSLFYAGAINRSGQFDPGRAVMRNLIIAETTNVDAAMLWNENINVQKINYIANTVGAAIEMPSNAGTPYTFTSLYFSGNTNDVYNSSGNSITVQKAGGSNPVNSEGSAVSFQASSTIFIRVQDESKADVAGAYVYINDDDSGAAEVNTTSDVNGEVSDSYSGAASTATLRVRKYGYYPVVDEVDLSADINRTITLRAHPQQT